MEMEVSFQPIAIEIPNGIRKIKSCKVYYNDKKKDFFLRVQRVAKNRVKSQDVSKNGYASPEHAEFDAERFINYMEENSDSSTFEKCCWPQIVGMNTDLNEREDREISEGQLRKKARLKQAYVAKKGIVDRRKENKIKKEIGKINKEWTKLVSKYLLEFK